MFRQRKGRAPPTVHHVITSRDCYARPDQGGPARVGGSGPGRGVLARRGGPGPGRGSRTGVLHDKDDDAEVTT